MVGGPYTPLATAKTLAMDTPQRVPWNHTKRPRPRAPRSLIRGHMLKDLRKKLDLSVNELADLLGVNERTVRRWEFGTRETPQAVILLLQAKIEINEQE